MAGMRLKNIPEDVRAARFRPCRVVVDGENQGLQWSTKGERRKVAHSRYEALDPDTDEVLGLFWQVPDPEGSSKPKWKYMRRGGRKELERVFDTSAEVCIYAAR